MTTLTRWKLSCALFAAIAAVATVRAHRGGDHNTQAKVAQNICLVAHDPLAPPVDADADADIFDGPGRWDTRGGESYLVVRREELGPGVVQAVSRLMMGDQYVHFHVFPRYSTERQFAGRSWLDATWPKPPDLQAGESDAGTLTAIRDALKAG